MDLGNESPAAHQLHLLCTVDGGLLSIQDGTQRHRPTLLTASAMGYVRWDLDQWIDAEAAEAVQHRGMVEDHQQERCKTPWTQKS